MTYSFDPHDVDSETKELATQLIRMANGMSSSDKRLADLAHLIAGEHRTLQQVVMRNFIMPLLFEWAEAFKSGRYDARNEATVRAAQLTTDHLYAENALGFPFI